MKKVTKHIIAGSFSILTAGTAAAESTGPLGRLESSAQQGIGGPASVGAQQENDRQRFDNSSRWSSLDRSMDGIEDRKAAFAARAGLSLSFDYTALYQHSSESSTGLDDAASGQLRMLGSWEILNRGGNNPGKFVFALEHRHKLGTDISPAEMAGNIPYNGATAVTFGAPGSILSVAYWQQTLGNGRGGFVAGRIDPGDYTDILGHVNPRTTFSNFAVLFSPVTPIPDPGFGIGGGGFLTDQVYALGVVSDANGSLSDVEWFPGGSELYAYAELGWTPSPSKRYLTNVHVGAFHTDAKSDAGVASNKGILLSANHTIDENLMLFGRLGWAEGGGLLAEKSANAGFMWRPGLYDDLFGFGVTVSEPPGGGATQTTAEAFYRMDLADNLALTGDLQYLNNPSSGLDDAWVFGLRLRWNI
ncbi:carbohydrate porin [Shimia thalassica]|uniref:carbohydrate porin n=1 Tax=Shimia thalassica TaxID=1715693 RepID=UPI002736DC2F|nr:carbohydrate porin [Shimia thalassica]MDP2493691.1 carbohydrate porin [Shimia thalassica]